MGSPYPQPWWSHVRPQEHPTQSTVGVEKSFWPRLHFLSGRNGCTSSCRRLLQRWPICSCLRSIPTYPLLHQAALAPVYTRWAHPGNIGNMRQTMERRRISDPISHTRVLMYLIGQHLHVMSVEGRNQRHSEHTKRSRERAIMVYNHCVSDRMSLCRLHAATDTRYLLELAL